MSVINFTCPHCSLTTQLGSDRVGTKGICPSCKLQFVITPEFPNPPPLSKPPPINPITDKSDCEVQNEVWKQPAAVGLSILGMTGVVVFLFCVILGACYLLLINRDAGNDSRTAADLVEHLNDAGFAGTFEMNMAGLIGAEDGGGFTGDNFSVEFFVFNDLSKAKTLEMDKRCYRNGNFVLMAHEAPEGLITAFTDW